MKPVEQPQTVSCEQIYQQLQHGDFVSPNQEWLGKIVASWLAGQSVLPDYLGLQPQQFTALQAHFFPGSRLPSQAQSGIVPDFSRMPEKEDLIFLLHSNAKDDSEESEWVIGIIVSACLGYDHLWQDLGLWRRPELTALMRYNFPDLAERNNKDMKWKKFIYKQLCEAEGLYLCRAPSCEVCSDYSNCFNTGDESD